MKMASSCEHNQIALQRPKEERFDDPTVFRAGPRVAPRNDIPLKKNKLGTLNSPSGRTL